MNTKFDCHQNKTRCDLYDTGCKKAESPYTKLKAIHSIYKDQNLKTCTFKEYMDLVHGTDMECVTKLGFATGAEYRRLVGELENKR